MKIIQLIIKYALKSRSFNLLLFLHFHLKFTQNMEYPQIELQQCRVKIFL